MSLWPIWKFMVGFCRFSIYVLKWILKNEQHEVQNYLQFFICLRWMEGNRYRWHIRMTEEEEIGDMNISYFFILLTGLFSTGGICRINIYRMWAVTINMSLYCFTLSLSICPFLFFILDSFQPSVSTFSVFRSIPRSSWPRVVDKRALDTN
jgi:hypothetical protein